jgi:Flp pilus assembly protein TadG
MKINRKSILSGLVNEESGQTLVFTALILVSFLGLSGMALDAGHGYYAYQRLKAATNAATLAGAAGMPDTSIASSNVAAYSSSTGKYNSLGSIMSNVVATPTFSCSSTVSTTFNVPCTTASGGSGGYNSISVCQTAAVKTWFGQFFGVGKFNLSACSMAAMAGGTNVPYNLAIIMDTTNSMTQTDKEFGCTGSKIACAVQGFQYMLEHMDPCALNTTCAGSGSYVDDVALYTFPVPTPGTVSKDYTCPNSNPAIVPYTFPNVNTGSSQNLVMPSTTGTYQVVGYSNDYKVNDATTALSTSSRLSKAVGYTGTGCNGLQAPGGEGTYYAQAIYKAQSDLVAQQTANPGSQNVLIILSDGDATACSTILATTSGTSTQNSCSGSSQIVATTGTLNGTGTKTSNASGYHSTVYPSALGECGQAVQAAQAATAAGTRVYSIGFDAPTSGGCTTDATYTTTISSTTNGAEAWPGGSYSRQPCNAIGAMASNAQYFYSDNTSGCPALNSNNSSYTSLPQIFRAIVTGLTSPRLIPVGTT